MNVLPLYRIVFIIRLIELVVIMEIQKLVLLENISKN